MASRASEVAARARGPRIVVALDFPNAEGALALARRLDPRRCRVKVGKELFTRAGPAVVERLAGAGFDVFLDLKFHDIPRTVAGACAAAAGLGCWMIDVHASGGRAMLEAAREALTGARRPPLLVAVTVLTSLDGDALREMGLASQPGPLAERLGALALACGLDGLVASPLELRALRARFGGAPCLVTPGVRPAGAPAGDQKRVATPEQALADGADFLVIGRPVTAAADPAAALAEIEQACERVRAD